jgi:hypothetical protein
VLARQASVARATPSAHFLWLCEDRVSLFAQAGLKP